MRLPVLAALLVLTLSACATTQQSTESYVVYDPFENLNRKVYGFNESVDKAVIGPVARMYANAVPEPGREGIRNAFANANTSVVLANDILQAKPQRAAETLSRFIINTTIGLGGLIDVAGKSGLEAHTEDFGQTLAVWGVPNGVYFVAPILGPSNLRDTTGRVVDTVFDPLTWLEFGLSDLDLYLNAGRTITTAVDTRAELERAFQNLRSQPEPYIALRRAYTTQRRNAIRDGAVSDDLYDNLPDFDDFDDEEFNDSDSGFETPSITEN